MQTIRKRLSVLFMICSITALLLITIFVNVTINNKFNQYMMDIQNRKYERIVTYFQQIYKRDGRWTDNSGIELMHEAYMGNYCLTLINTDEQSIWGMNPKDIQSKLNLSKMLVKDRGVYNSKRFEIKVDNKVVGYVEIGQYSSVLLSEDDINFKTTINKSIIASGVLTLIIIVVISLYFSKQFSIPIREVEAMSVNLSKGNFNTKSNIKSNIEELENLRKSVNILAEKLKYQDTLRKRLVSDISHEIRTPLNILQNNLEAMIDGVFPVTNDTLNYLNEEVVRFGGLLNNLNVLKEFESESIRINFEKVFLNELIEDVCKDFYIAAENKGIKLNYIMENNKELCIAGDKDKLKQIFINLISNAIKFTEEDGEISVNLYSNHKNIIIDIKDNGIGIKKEDLPFIFERLYRGDKSRHQIEGSGIGLTIVKNILQLHLASIDVESEEGKGSKFTVYFNKYTY
ncbi:signal transduction histidine kinase [Clostridium tetanomorphum]|uniref:sensor histidine kinase n=1 Tax=Clostridium tetanomorphum TaxID=1553 RepID=UPI00044ADE2D|nr:ATP-binding protein [Clostridium tetanomorphum]KAJ53546.1 two component system histidine kinase [Clostridium tetanomorphum DSM 665]MBP1863116.1 signal transduction histidine kinase [Clostridium tetanomorphum]NRS84225.1 signal transduction histidine kinase [Clostridium tetanomorphum]SQB92489.1 sensor histidine kinase [Clostridium tetanomorphum]